MVLKNEMTFAIDNEVEQRETEMERESNEQEIRPVNEFSVDRYGIKSEHESYVNGFPIDSPASSHLITSHMPIDWP